MNETVEYNTKIKIEMGIKQEKTDGTENDSSGSDLEDVEDTIRTNLNVKDFLVDDDSVEDAERNYNKYPNLFYLDKEKKEILVCYK